MKRLFSLISAYSLQATLFFHVALFVFLCNSSLALPNNDIPNLPIFVISDFAIWDITRACTNPGCTPPNNTLGQKICCIETMISLILDKVCETQSLVENIQAKVDALESCQEEICAQNAVDASLVENIIHLADEINTEICDIATKIEIIDINALSINEQITELVSGKTINTLSLSILEQTSKNLSALDPIQLLANSTLDKLNASLLLENSIAQTLSKTDSSLLTSRSLLDITASKDIIIDSRLDGLQSFADTIDSKLDVMTACNAIPISQPTLISSAGIYCLTSDIAGQITIGASNVQLSMNGHRVYNGTNGIQLQPNISRIIIDGPGSVGPVTNAGILVGNGDSAVRINNVFASTCTTAGFLCNGSSALPISDVQFNNCSADTSGIGFSLLNTIIGQLNTCEMVSNSTGFQEQSSSAIVLDNCIASRNTITGFNLVSSSTNILTNCKAYNNGLGSTGSSFGFASSNGSANIFENCLADGTTTLTTNINSVVAGFALTGSEAYSKIIGCESVNAFAPFTTSFTGTSTITVGTIPYGIVLQSMLINNGQPTANPAVSIAGNISSSSLAWSPDGKYIAVASSSINILTNPSLITIFNATNPVSPIAYSSVSINSGLEQLAWSPDGRYLAVVSNVNIITINVINPANPIASTPVNTGIISPTFVAWSPDSKYIVAAGAPGSANQLVTIDATNPATPIPNTPVVANGSPRSVAWSPDGKYIAIATSASYGIQTFNVVNPATPIAYPAVPVGNGDNIPTSIAWSPDSKYLTTVTSGGNLITFNTLNPAAPVAYSAVLTISTLRSVTWSPDGKYIAAGNSSNLVLFNAINPTAPVAYPTVPTGTTTLQQLVWSPDGRYIAEVNLAPSNSLITFNVLQFPTSNIIKENIVYCNNGGSTTQPNGIGISGSSIANAIINNTAYNNNAFNYQFVTNVFNQQFNTVPSPLQNVAIKSLEAIANQPNIGQQLNNDLVIAQNLSATDAALAYDQSIIDQNFGFMRSLTDIIIREESFIISLLPKITSTCGETPLTATGSFVIASAGSYCLANNVTGGVTINASNVTFNLNGHQIINAAGNAITVNSGLSRVNIFNGRVEGTNNNGIVLNGVSLFNILDIVARNSARGIQLNNANYGTIARCDFSSNSTGIELNTSTNVIIDSCQATTNGITGFSLASSGTNVITNCKAIANGIASTGNSYGFISTNGKSNIFTNCINDGTTTTTTNFNSLVAGFALTGSELCSEIVNCESGNNTAPFISSLVSTSTLTTGPSAVGIVLNYTQNSSLVLTGTAVQGTFSQGVAWSPDQQYLGTAGFPQNGNTVQIFTVNPNLANSISTLRGFAAQSPSLGFACAWSPNQKYFAACGDLNTSGNNVQVYNFNPTQSNAISSQVGSAIQGNASLGAVRCFYLAWSTSGNYLATCGYNTTAGNTDEVQVFRVNPVNSANIISQRVGNVGPSGSGNFVSCVAFSPNDNYIAIAELTTNNFYVYNFNPALANAIGTQVANRSVSNTSGVAWSPDGKYLATAASSISVWLFDPTQANALVGPVSSATPSSPAILLSWSPDGKYLAACTGASGNNVIVYSFNPRSASLTPVLVASQGSTGNALQPAWSPDGQYLATAGNPQNGATNQIFSTLTFPRNNVIKNNIVYGNNAGTTSQPYGIGLSGSSIANLIVNNIAYNNNLFCYVFVTNVFNQLLYGTNIPSPLQNICLAGNTPITKPINTYQETNILQQQAIQLNSTIDQILTKLLP